MGVKGLWAAMKPYVNDGNLNQFKGQRVAIDMYVWLHRGIHHCVELQLDNINLYLEKKYYSTHLSECGGNAAASEEANISIEELVVISSRFIEAVVGKVEALQRFGITPVCVFDGAEMPMKRGTDEARQQRRDQCFREALGIFEKEYERCRRVIQNGRTYPEALQLLEKAVDISTELAYSVIQVLREEKHVECIVSPYEADAQLAYLCREGYVQAVISEDSDLIAYYCPCIIAKLDSGSGRCHVLLPLQAAPRFYAEMAASAMSRKSTIGISTRQASSSASQSSASNVSPTDAGDRCDPFKSPSRVPASFTYESFLLGCIMSGCDYVPNLRQVGIRTIFKVIAHCTSFPHLLQLLEVQFGFPHHEVKRYQRQVLTAFYCFVHHIVYCPLQRRVVHYHPLSLAFPNSGGARGRPVAANAVAKTDLVGELWPADVAKKVCEECLLDPGTLQLYKGLYQASVITYLRDTRRGQVSLNAFNGFQKFVTPKVVVYMGENQGEGRRPRPVSEKDEDNDFHSPLKKLRTAKGYIGVATDTSGKQSAIVNARAVVRSRYFLRGGPENDHACFSDSDDEHVSGDEQRVHGVHCNGDTNISDKNSAGKYLGRCTLPDTLAKTDHSVIEHTLSPVKTAESSAGTSQNSAAERSSAPKAPSPALTGSKEQTNWSCPFGYVECIEEHSIFQSCFTGKPWTRKQPTAVCITNTTANTQQQSSPTTDHNSRSSMHSAQVYAPLAFRAPRRTAPIVTAGCGKGEPLSPSKPDSCGSAVTSRVHEAEQSPSSEHGMTAPPPPVAEPSVTEGASAVQWGMSLFERLTFTRR